MTTPGSPPTMAPADLLIGLLERVPMSEAQIARATQAEPETIRAWLRRREGSCGARGSATRLSSWRSSRRWRATFAADALVEWLDRDIDFLDGANPLDELAGGGYERLIQFARGLTYGVFT